MVNPKKFHYLRKLLHLTYLVISSLYFPIFHSIFFHFKKKSMKLILESRLQGLFHFHYFNFAPGRYLPTSDPYLNTFKIRILKNWIDNPGWNAFTLITLTLMDFISTYLISFNFNFRLRIWNPFVLKFKIWIRLNTGNRYDPNR